MTIQMRAKQAKARALILTLEVARYDLS